MAEEELVIALEELIDILLAMGKLASSPPQFKFNDEERKFFRSLTVQQMALMIQMFARFETKMCNAILGR